MPVLSEKATQTRDPQESLEDEIYNMIFEIGRAHV